VNSLAPILITATGGRKPDEGVLAALPDGTLVWSDDRALGGPPYQVGRIAPEAVERALRSVAAEGWFVGQRYFGPDARRTHIVMNLASDRIVDAESWHEIAERDPEVVATATGIEPLNGRDRAAVLAAQPEAYRAFRARWERVKDAAWRLCPKVGRPARPTDLESLPWDSVRR
jgi:hypothetical protein